MTPLLLVNMMADCFDCIVDDVGSCAVEESVELDGFDSIPFIIGSNIVNRDGSSVVVLDDDIVCEEGTTD
jgi:hypothetical protein